MLDILHKVGIKSSSPHQAYRALTTRDGLSAWWTDDTKAKATSATCCNSALAPAGST